MTLHILLYVNFVYYDNCFWVREKCKHSRDSILFFTAKTSCCFFEIYSSFVLLKSFVPHLFFLSLQHSLSVELFFPRAIWRLLSFLPHKFHCSWGRYSACKIKFILVWDLVTIEKLIFQWTKILYYKLAFFSVIWVFANGPGDIDSIPGHVVPKTFKMLLDASLLNTQQYKVRIKSKVEQSRERSSALPYTL